MGQTTTGVVVAPSKHSRQISWSWLAVVLVAILVITFSGRGEDLLGDSGQRLGEGAIFEAPLGDIDADGTDVTRITHSPAHATVYNGVWKPTPSDPEAAESE